MLAEYKRKSNIAVWVCVLSVVPLAVAAMNSEGNIWENGNILAMTSETICVGAFAYAVWAYVKSKGRSGFWVIAPIFGNVIGLIILASLKDKSPEGNKVETDSK